MKSHKKILCIGEILWDALPTGLFLGGAPLNVSFHLHQLGEKVNVISRVGDDRLGKEAVRRIESKKLPVDLIQQDQDFETGIVEVKLDKEGNPDYKIIGPVAWDKIALTEQIKEEAANAWAIVYGSLALRDEISCDTIHSLLSEDLLKVLDVNLRKPFYSKKLIKKCMHTADVLKLNKDELKKIIDWFSLPENHREAIDAISDHFSCDTISVTRGGEGATLFHNGQWSEHAGFEVAVKDAVGAGDAFLAALLQGLRMGLDIRETLIFANAAGAYVASQSGATPEYTRSMIEALIADSR